LTAGKEDLSLHGVSWCFLLVHPLRKQLAIRLQGKMPQKKLQLPPGRDFCLLIDHLAMLQQGKIDS
jgi:hypothetical protein